MKIKQPEFELYLKEILSFLKTVTIKFTPFEKLMNNLYYGKINTIDIRDDNVETDWSYKLTYPYYINLNGEYHEYNTPMYINTKDNSESILLTKDNLTSELRDFYLQNPEIYNSLINKYPDQTDLIKAIFFPIKSVEEAIYAPNLKLLAYDASYLYENEKEDMLFFLSSFLSYVNYRWYIPTFEYENLYPLAFWSMLWSLLPLMLVTKRILNIKTLNVHPYHIWEYLESKGFYGYKNILTNDQALYLYKNINYLLKHRGKQFVLDELEKIFLHPYNFSLIGKTIYHSTYERENDAIWLPEVVDTRKDEITNEKISLSSFIYDINLQGFDDNIDPLYIKSIEERFKKEKENILFTKFYEIKKPVSDDRYAFKFLSFEIDTIFYLFSKDKLNFDIDINNSLITSLTSDQAVILMLYCILKYISKEFNDQYNIPTTYNITSAITLLNKPDDYPNSFFVNGIEYKTKDYLNVDEFYNRDIYPTNINSSTDLSNLIINQFDFIMDQAYYLNTTFDTIGHACIRKQLYYLMPKINITFDFGYTTFKEFFDANTNIKSYVDSIAFDQNNALELFKTILDSLVSMENQISKYLDPNKYGNVFWEKIKELFISMSSYNVAFLLNSKDKLPAYTLPYIKLSDYETSREQIQLIGSDIPECINVGFITNVTIDSNDKTNIYNNEKITSFDNIERIDKINTDLPLILEKNNKTLLELQSSPHTYLEIEYTIN